MVSEERSPDGPGKSGADPLRSSSDEEDEEDSQGETATDGTEEAAEETAGEESGAEAGEADGKGEDSGDVKEKEKGKGKGKKKGDGSDPDEPEAADGDEYPDDIFEDHVRVRTRLEAEKARMETEVNTWKEVAIKAESERRFIESELMKLQNEVRHLNQELKKLRAPPHILGTILESLDDGRILVKSSTGPRFAVTAGKTVDKEELKPGTSVALNRDSLSIIDVLPLTKDTMVSSAEVIEKPTISFEQIGGLEEQKVEIKETVELPLVKPELFEKVGVDPPVGVLLIGPPGTGKTMLAQGVANSTEACFIRLVGSELVQKFIGEGGRLVRELFSMAREKAPSIIFIDELDAIAAKRLETGTSADREVQRTLMQLLAEIDGFNALGNVRLMAATNRPDILDEAITRPGRFDRIITIPLPDQFSRHEIFKIHTQRMNLSKGVDLEEMAGKTDGMSGAEIKAICTEAGMFAIREDRDHVTMDDLLSALEKVKHEEIATQAAPGMFA
jgi:proteasome regulatory subunit